MYKRQSIPKLSAEAINQAIILYETDQGQLPSSMNELIIKKYITLSEKPFNNHNIDHQRGQFPNV